MWNDLTAKGFCSGGFGLWKSEHCSGGQELKFIMQRMLKTFVISLISSPFGFETTWVFLMTMILLATFTIHSISTNERRLNQGIQAKVRTDLTIDLYKKK